MKRPYGNAPMSFSKPQPLHDYLDGEFLSLHRRLSDLATSRNVQVCLVGGPVRDILLGLPVKDLDYVVVGDAPALARSLAEMLGARVRVHARFGTATVFHNGVSVDLVTARRETYPVQGSLPVIEPSSLDHDLARRDFSINAMAISIDGQGETLVDPQGGRRDLELRLVRILHDNSFRDDPTRLFRAIRYEQRLGFSLEKETEAELRSAVDARCLDTVTGDRIRHELERMFSEEFPGRALSRTIQTGVLASLAPGLDRTDFVERWASEQRVSNILDGTGTLTWLAALVFPFSPSEAESLILRLNMPATWAKVVRDTVAAREAESWLSRSDLTGSEIAGKLEGIARESLYLVAAVTESAAASSNFLRYLTKLQHVETLLKGKDLITLGVPAGPELGRALACLRDARLDEKVHSEKEEREWVAGFLGASFREPAV